MSFDDDEYFGNYGCFIDASSVLTNEEYSSKVLFDEELLKSISNSEFKEDFFNLDLPFEKNKQDYTIAFNFGDLLAHVPVYERLKWKQLYRRIELAVVPVVEAYTLLFFDIENTGQVETVKDYWKKRSDIEVTGAHPWFSESEMDQTIQKSRYLNQIDLQTNEWMDLKSMSFKPEVLDKYKNNELCEVDSIHISFLRHDKTPVSIAWFNIRKNVLMMYAKDFNNVPIIERDYWRAYQIHSEQEGLQ